MHRSLVAFRYIHTYVYPATSRHENSEIKIWVCFDYQIKVVSIVNVDQKTLRMNSDGLELPRLEPVMIMCNNSCLFNMELWLTEKVPFWGSLDETHLGGIKQCKVMVNLGVSLTIMHCLGM